MSWPRPRAASKTFHARQAILEHLDDLEDLYLAEQRLIEVRAGQRGTQDMESMLSEAGLED